MDGWIAVDDLSKWVLGVERRVLVMKALETPGAFSAADIAISCDRSVQNISRAIRELEGRGLIECLTPGKRTWKRYILTGSGKSVLEELNAAGLIR
jgi:predicted transcriptional regulator